MEYLRIEEEFPHLVNSAVTLGKFDGIHRGHRKLVEKIKEQKQNGAQTVMFAFDVSNQMILTREERCRLAERMGIDLLIECPLNDKIKHMKAETFIKQILVSDLNVSYVAVGEDFRFGYERKGTPELLSEYGKKYNFQTEILSKETDGHRKISSTFIREELRLGNIEKVNDLMGMEFIVEGIIEHGRGLGHKVLLPTTNIVPPKEKIMPPNGVYVTESIFEDKSYGGITNVGYKPTVGEKFLGVETYLFGCDEDLYGKFCQVRFKHYQRPEKKFNSLEALKEQLLKDVRSGEEYISGKEPSSFVGSGIRVSKD